MRYQFWRDNINRAFEYRPPKQPVTILLTHALADLEDRSRGTAKLSKRWLLRTIAAREQYGDGRPYTSLDALEKYAEDTYSTLLYLTLQSFPLASMTADHIASHIGKAMGITAVLRGLPLLAFPPPPNHHANISTLPGSAGLDMPRRSQQGTVALPLDVTARTGLKEEDVFRKGAEAPGLRDAVFEVATRASDHLITARQMLKDVYMGQEVDHMFEYKTDEERGHHLDNSVGQDSTSDRPKSEVEQAFSVFMPAVSTSLWLDRLQALDFDIFQDSLRRGEWKLPWKAYFAFRRRMF